MVLSVGDGVARVVLVASSVFLALVGALLLFLPAVMAAVLGLPGAAASGLQVAAAPLVGMAALNWVGRGAIYGGIYGRPVVVANFLTGGITSLVLVRLLLDAWAASSLLFLVPSVVYWAAFATLLFRPPTQRRR